MLSRRAFVAAGASAFAAFGAIRWVGAQGRAVVRRSIGAMAANDPDLAAYRRAVAAMKALPPADPRNWNRIANIHRNFCPHGNWYFLPWHRAYLAAFERICRELSGKPDFALPYWDWTNQRQVPPAFAAGNAASNPLFHPRTITDSLPDDMVGREVITRVLRSPDFEAFGSTRPDGQDSVDRSWLRREGTRTELEFNPHDGVHISLGGDMSQVTLSSRDPIFWLHHGNIDRLWASWNQLGHDNSREPNWLQFEFDRQFPNPDGSAWNVAVSDLQTPDALGYAYDDMVVAAADNPMDAYAAGPVLRDAQRPLDRDVPPAPAADQQPIRPAPQPRDVQAPASRLPSSQLTAYRQIGPYALSRQVRGARRIALASGEAFYFSTADNDLAASRDRPVAIPVPFSRPLPQLIGPALEREPTAGQVGLRVWATLRDIEPPRDKTTRLRVFTNCEAMSPRTPLNDVSYATSVSFFGGDHSQHSSNRHGSVSVDLTPTLRRMYRGQRLNGDRIVLQLLPVCQGADIAASNVRPRRVEVALI